MTGGGASPGPGACCDFACSVAGCWALCCCVAGAFAWRAMVADVALPGIFTRLKGLRLDQSEPVRIGGWAFRGLLNLPVTWEA